MKKKQSVTHRTKHDSKSRRKAPKLGEHPAMKELFRMVEAAEINQERTLGYLTSRRKSPSNDRGRPKHPAPPSTGSIEKVRGRGSRF
jgi:hypothetical protein